MYRKLVLHIISELKMMSPMTPTLSSHFETHARTEMIYLNEENEILKLIFERIDVGVLSWKLLAEPVADLRQRYLI